MNAIPRFTMNVDKVYYWPNWKEAIPMNLKRDEILGPLTLHGTKGYLSKVKINHYDTMSIYRDTRL